MSQLFAIIYTHPGALNLLQLIIFIQNMNDLRGPSYPHRQQFICPQHPPHVFVSYCLRCSIPLCLECQDVHTDLHYKNNIPVQLKSIQRVQEETEVKLREALGTYQRYIHSMESVIRNPIHYDRVLEEIDTAHRNIIKDINRFFVGLKQKYEEFRKMPDFHTKHQALAKRANELDDQLVSLGYQKTLEVISLTNSEKFMKDWEKDAKDVESIVDKNKQLISSAVVSEDDLQNILRYNIDRYVNGSRYLKSKGLPLRSSTNSPMLKQDQLSNEIRGSILNRSLANSTPDSPEKDNTERKTDRALSLERTPFKGLRQELDNSLISGTAMARNGLNSILKNSPNLSLGRPGEGRYTGLTNSNEIRLASLDSRNFGGRGDSLDRARVLTNSSFSPIK